MHINLVFVVILCVSCLLVAPTLVHCSDSRSVGIKGSCRNSSHCHNGYYCHFDNGSCTENGLCTPIPKYCPQIYSPVCGCDNETYSNWCAAAQNSVSIQSCGPCAGDNSCTSDSQCSTSSQYCAFTTGQCNGTGECTEKPQMCYMIYSPVCGCDGNTYSNACVAASAGVNVKSQGAC